MMGDDEIEEGSPCNQENCAGRFELAPVVGCSCHISPPCSACTNAGFACDTCGHDTTVIKYPESYLPTMKQPVDRHDAWTHTKTSGPFNSTPFTDCCGTAAINTDRCPTCRAQIRYHDDGLAARRRWANGGCLMCGKPLPKERLGEAGTCTC